VPAPELDVDGAPNFLDEETTLDNVELEREGDSGKGILCHIARVQIEYRHRGQVFAQPMVTPRRPGSRASGYLVAPYESVRVGLPLLGNAVGGQMPDQWRLLQLVINKPLRVALNSWAPKT